MSLACDLSFREPIDHIFGLTMPRWLQPLPIGIIAGVEFSPKGPVGMDHAVPRPAMAADLSGHDAARAPSGGRQYGPGTLPCRLSLSPSQKWHAGRVRQVGHPALALGRSRPARHLGPQAERSP